MAGRTDCTDSIPHPFWLLPLTPSFFAGLSKRFFRCDSFGLARAGFHDCLESNLIRRRRPRRRGGSSCCLIFPRRQAWQGQGRPTAERTNSTLKYSLHAEMGRRNRKTGRRARRRMRAEFFQVHFFSSSSSFVSRQQASV